MTTGHTTIDSPVGRLTLVDRDYVELHNLQRQALYDEVDVERAADEPLEFSSEFDTTTPEDDR